MARDIDTTIMVGTHLYKCQSNHSYCQTIPSTSWDSFSGFKRTDSHVLFSNCQCLPSRTLKLWWPCLLILQSTIRQYLFLLPATTSTNFFAAAPIKWTSSIGLFPVAYKHGSSIFNPKNKLLWHCIPHKYLPLFYAPLVSKTKIVIYSMSTHITFHWATPLK